MDPILADGLEVVFGFLSGAGALWVATWKKRTEYRDWLKRRRVVGAKAAERMQLVKSHAETLIKMKQRGLTPESLFDFMEYSTTGKRRTAPALIVRKDSEIEAAIQELYDKLTWDRVAETEQMILCGYEPPDPKKWGAAKKWAREVEQKYGTQRLGWSRYGSGVIEGKLAALFWLIGESWDFLGEPEEGGYPQPDMKTFAEDVQDAVEFWGGLKVTRALNKGGRRSSDPIGATLTIKVRVTFNLTRPL